MSSRWLAPYSWEFITAQNAALCAAKDAMHGPTSEGYEEARKLWTDRCASELTLMEAVEVCRKCHQLAPFCFYNGNTFVAVVRDRESGGVFVGKDGGSNGGGLSASGTELKSLQCRRGDRR